MGWEFEYFLPERKFEKVKNISLVLWQRNVMQCFSADAKCFEKNLNKKILPMKTSSKVAHNWPNFFLVLPTGPKPAQISNIFHRNLPPPDFYIMTLRVWIIIDPRIFLKWNALQDYLRSQKEIGKFEFDCLRKLH